MAEVRATKRGPSPKRAAEIRRAAGITQARMALALGIDRSTLARWETGHMTPRQTQAGRWRDLLAQIEHELSA